MPSFVAHKLQVGCTCVDDLLLLDEEEFGSMGLTSLNRKRLIRAISIESKYRLQAELTRLPQRIWGLKSLSMPVPAFAPGRLGEVSVEFTTTIPGLRSY